MSTHKHACLFPNCTRKFDRYKRLEKHFQDHLQVMNKVSPTGQRRTAISLKPRNRASEKQRGRKHRSSNLRKQWVVHASGRLVNNAPSARETTMIDLRTPSLSPDTLSDTESESQPVEVPITPQSQTPRRGPIWVTASPKPTPERTLHQTEVSGRHESTPSFDRSVQNTVMASYVAHTAAQEGNQQALTDDADDEDEDGGATMAPNENGEAGATEAVSATGIEMEQARSHISAIADNAAKVGLTGYINPIVGLEAKLGTEDINMAATERQLSSPPKLSTPPCRTMSQQQPPSPFANLSSGAPRPGRSRYLPQQVPHAATIGGCAATGVGPATPPSSNADASTSPNSYDRFILAAEKVLADEYTREETPCPMPLGFTGDEELSKQALAGHEATASSGHTSEQAFSDAQVDDPKSVTTHIHSPKSDVAKKASQNHSNGPRDLTSGWSETSSSCGNTPIMTDQSHSDMLIAMARHVLSCPSLQTTRAPESPTVARTPSTSSTFPHSNHVERSKELAIELSRLLVEDHEGVVGQEGETGVQIKTIVRSLADWWCRDLE